MALSIRQKAKNYTVYPIVPLKVALPAASVANSLLAVLVIGQRTPYNFNEDLLVTETVAPVVKDDVGNTYTQQNQIVDIYTELSTSPPVVSPDASGYFPSLYLFTSPATAGGSPAVQPSTITVTDAGLYGTAQSPPTLGRPVFDGGITAIAFEIAGKYTGSGQTVVDKTAISETAHAALGAGILVPTNNSELVLELGVLIDSSAIGLGAAGISPPTVAAAYQDSGNIAASGSSYWLIQSTLHGAEKDTSAGFSNPIQYAGGVLAVAFA